MEEKRENKLEEYELFHANFKLAKPTIITFVILIIVSFIIMIAGMADNFREDLTIPGAIITLVLGIVFAIKLALVKNNECVVTNKRIFGTKVSGFVIKTFSYRLDTIESAQAISCLGARKVKFFFTRGKVGVNPIYYQSPKIESFKLNNVDNHMEFYENLSKMIVSVKNDTDLVVGLASDSSKKTK